MTEASRGGQAGRGRETVMINQQNGQKVKKKDRIKRAGAKTLAVKSKPSVT